MLNKYVCGRGEAQKKPSKKQKKKAGSYSVEIVFDLAELSHLHTEVSRSRAMSRFLEFINPLLPRCGNYNPHDHCLKETVHILTD